MDSEMRLLATVPFTWRIIVLKEEENDIRTSELVLSLTATDLRH
jgi:hypothetical protein